MSPDLLNAVELLLSKIRIKGLEDFLYEFTKLSSKWPQEKIKGGRDLRHLVLKGRPKTCLDCDKEIGLQSTRCASCATKKSTNDPKTQAKQRATCLSRHGGQAMGSKKTRAKIEKVNLEKYGARVAGANVKRLQKKTRATTIERHGGLFNGSQSIKAKSKETIEQRLTEDSSFLRRAGIKANQTTKMRDAKNPERLAQRISKRVKLLAKRLRENPNYWHDINSKRIKTKDATNPNWRREQKNYLNSARYKLKRVVLRGKEFVCMGYEPLMLKHLVAKGHRVQDIRIEERYYHYVKSNGTLGYYWPDIFVKDRLIEVKSSYTAGLDANGTALWKNVQRKSAGVAAAGQSLLVVIIDPKKGFMVLQDIHTMTRKEARSSLTNFKPFAFQ